MKWTVLIRYDVDGSEWMPGSSVTSNSMSVPRNALPLSLSEVAFNIFEK